MGKLTFVYDIDEAVTEMASLAGLDAAVIDSKIDGSRKRGFRITKTEWYFEATGLHALAGPILFGWAVGLTAAEIEEALEADPQDPNNASATERVQRPVFPLGVIPRAQNTSESSVETPRIKPLMTMNPNWSIPEDVGFTWWIYNLGGATDAGAGGSLFAKHYGVWLND